ncbi:MAG: hypothetical protein U9R34_06270 [Nanoarchaeota archaeon]|nr:hypothetical protein [Nanoarchaeota archaeon]
MGKYYTVIRKHTRKARRENKPKEDNIDKATAKIQKSFGLGKQGN